MDKKGMRNCYADGGFVDIMAKGLRRTLRNLTEDDKSAPVAPQPQAEPAKPVTEKRIKSASERAIEEMDKQGYKNGGAVDVSKHGLVEGKGTGKSDSIPAVIDGKKKAALSNGEFVAPVEMVDMIGLDNLEDMREQALTMHGKDAAPGIRKFAMGGGVDPNEEWVRQQQSVNANRTRQTTMRPGLTPNAAPAAPTVSPMPEASGASRLSQVGDTLRSGLGKARSVVNGPVGKVAAGLAVTGALADSAEQDSTARYAQRFGVNEPTGDGTIGDMAKFAALRAGGFASDLGNNLTLGLAGKFYRDSDMPRQEVPSPDPQVAAPAAAPGGLPPATRDPASFADASGRLVDENNGNPLLALRRPGQPTEYTSAADMTYGKPLGRGNVSTYQTDARDAMLLDKYRASRGAQEAEWARNATLRESGGGEDRKSAVDSVASEVRRLSTTGGRAGRSAADRLLNAAKAQDDFYGANDRTEATLRQRGAGDLLAFESARMNADQASQDRALAREDRNFFAGENIADRRAAAASATEKAQRDNLNNMVDDLASDPVVGEDGKTVKSYVRNPQRAAQISKIAEELTAAGQPVNRQTIETALKADAPIQNMNRDNAANGLPTSNSLRDFRHVGEVTLPSIIEGDNNITISDYVNSLFQGKDDIRNMRYWDPKTGTFTTGSRLFGNDQDVNDLYRKGK